MNTIIHHLESSRSSRAATTSPVDFRHPNYDCREQEGAVKLIVYVPGVDTSGIEITARGPDLMVSARKSRFIRPNFRSLHIEAVQKDYLLKLRLGKGLDYARLNAEIHEGILTITVPKLETTDTRGRLRLAA